MLLRVSVAMGPRRVLRPRISMQHRMDDRLATSHDLLEGNCAVPPARIPVVAAGPFRERGPCGPSRLFDDGEMVACDRSRLLGHCCC